MAETPAQREELVLLILPFVVLPQRVCLSCSSLHTNLIYPQYPIAEAPPNHFHLPLAPANPLHQPPLTMPIPSIKPEPARYPHYLPSRPFYEVHFRSRPDLSPPLITIAAKLLFVARREIFPIRVPATPPPGLSPADYADLNRGKAAALPRGARWDWDAGVPRPVNREENDKDVLVDGAESKNWDTEWWRRRLCWDYMAPRPRFAPGLTYTPGCMRGLWQGRIYVRVLILFLHFSPKPSN